MDIKGFMKDFLRNLVAMIVIAGVISGLLWLIMILGQINVFFAMAITLIVIALFGAWVDRS